MVASSPLTSPTSTVSNGKGVFPSHQPQKPRSPFYSWFRAILPPVTSKSLFSHYLPASGAISHTLYTTHIFSPSIVHRLFPLGELAVSNVILFNTNLGVGFWVYFRPHLARADSWTRVEFSVFAATIFNFGSLLAAVLIKQILPRKTSVPVRTVIASALSLFLLSRAYRYVRFIDRRRVHVSSSSKASSPNPEHVAVNGTHTNGGTLHLNGHSDGHVNGINGTAH